MRSRWVSCRQSFAASSSKKGDIEEENPMRLTPELLKIANAFASVKDDRVRSRQLLHMGTQLTPLEPTQLIPENKVPGCLSTVHVDATAVDKGEGQVYIEFVGDSDGLLTKGLAALLIRGLSNNTVDAIQNVDPAFIQATGIAATVAPGRSNGFLNMLNLMKKKAKEVEAEYEASAKKNDENAPPECRFTLPHSAHHRSRH